MHLNVFTYIFNRGGGYGLIMGTDVIICREILRQNVVWIYALNSKVLLILEENVLKPIPHEHA